MNKYTFHTDHFTPQHTDFEHTQQHAYQSFLSYFLGFSVSNIVTRWVNFREKHLHKHEIQLSDYNIGKYLRPNAQISGRKIEKYFFSNFCLKFFQGQTQK